MDVLIPVLDTTIRLAIPLLFACLAGLFSERAGIFDIGLEGKMLAAAFFSAALAAITGSVWLGLLAGIAASVALSGVPIFGQIYADLISGHTILVYVGFLCVPLTWWVLFRTRFGLRLRAVGENPAAVDTAGISVYALRYAAVGICGILCGLAGAYLATGLQAGFVKDMSSGRGYIALAALIFAKWRPWYALYATMLFGFLQALSLRPDVVQTILQFRVPVQFLDALPYVLTVIILAGFVGKAIPPKAGGAPYVKER